MHTKTQLLTLIKDRLTQLSIRKSTIDLKIESYEIPFIADKDRELVLRQLEEEIKYNNELIRILHL